jgi:hypothetical protein
MNTNALPPLALPLPFEPTSLVELVERGQWALRNLDNEEQTLWPVRLSAIGGCQRETALRLRNPSRSTLDARALRIFDLGRARGEAFARYVSAGLEEYGYHVENETRLHCKLPVTPELADDLRAAELLAAANHVQFDAPAGWAPKLLDSSGKFQIGGHSDIILRDPSGHLVDIIEVKTKADYGFDKLGEEGPGDPYDRQLAAYHLAELQHQRDLDPDRVVTVRTWFLFENKDNSALEVMPWRSHSTDDLGALEAMILPLMANVAHDLAAWSRGEEAEPEAPFKLFAEKRTNTMRLPWQCSYCSHGPVLGNCFPGTPLRERAKRMRNGAVGKPDWISPRGAQ